MFEYTVRLSSGRRIDTQKAVYTVHDVVHDAAKSEPSISERFEDHIPF